MTSAKDFDDDPNPSVPLALVGGLVPLLGLGFVHWGDVHNRAEALRELNGIVLVLTALGAFVTAVAIAFDSLKSAKLSRLRQVEVQLANLRDAHQKNPTYSIAEFERLEADHIADGEAESRRLSRRRGFLSGLALGGAFLLFLGAAGAVWAWVIS